MILFRILRIYMKQGRQKQQAMMWEKRYCRWRLKAMAKSKNKYINISVISSDDIEQAQFTKPMLTTVALPKEEMARFAVYLLINRIKGQHTSVTKVELEGKLIARESCVDVEYSSWNYYI